MADELDLDLDELDQDIERRNKVEERIKTLSSKVADTAAERNELKELNEALSLERDELVKEKDFLSSFTTETGKFPGASEYKDAIWEKVKAGYTVQDATVSVLNQEGKLVPGEPTPEAPAPKADSPAGGSAATIPTSLEEKGIEDMTRDEKLSALKELEAKGDLSTR